MKRSPLLLAFAVVVILPWPAQAQGGEGPDPVFDKPDPLSMAELTKRTTTGVSAVEVKDYTYGNYKGDLKPSPPHADRNPQKAVIVFWKDHSQRFVFSHEASYCPWLELTRGAGMANQFFEGNLGDAELFNTMGRKEKNSFVDIIQSGPQRVWIRWNYFCVNMKDDSQPRLRGTEDYLAFPNGLVLRRMKYESLMPDKVIGYSTQPVELFGVAPAGSSLPDLFPLNVQHGDYHILSALDVYADRRYDIFWNKDGKVSPSRRRSSSPGHLPVARLCSGHSLQGKVAVCRPGKVQRLRAGERPAHRSLHAGSGRRRWLGCRTVGSLAGGLVEFPNFLLETDQPVSLQFRLDRTFPGAGPSKDQDFLEGLFGTVQGHGVQLLDREAGVLCSSGCGPRLG